MKSELKVTPDEQKKIDDMLASAGTIDPTPDSEGLLGWAEYIKLFKVIVALQVRYSIETKNQMADARRAHLESGNKQEFAKSCQGMI